jgi:hypothetical protein
MWEIIREYAKPVGIVVAGVLGAELLHSIVNGAKGYIPDIRKAPAQGDKAPEAPTKKVSEATTA